MPAARHEKRPHLDSRTAILTLLRPVVENGPVAHGNLFALKLNYNSFTRRVVEPFGVANTNLHLRGFFQNRSRNRVGRALGVDDILAELLPEQKLQRVESCTNATKIYSTGLAGPEFCYGL